VSPQITGLSCHSPGGLGNEDPPVYFGNQLLTCDVNVSGQVDSYDWVLDLTGFRGTSAQFRAGLPGMDPANGSPVRSTSPSPVPEAATAAASTSSSARGQPPGSAVRPPVTPTAPLGPERGAVAARERRLDVKLGGGVPLTW
jgi:hypothetical protein